MSQPQQLFTIQQISRKLDIPKSTLRFWEKEFDGLLTPIRTRGGQRRYSEEHVKILSRISMQKKEGMSLDQIKNKFLQSDAGRPNYSDSEYIDLLADRVAGLVKEEVYRFLLEGDNSNIEIEK